MKRFILMHVNAHLSTSVFKLFSTYFHKPFKIASDYLHKLFKIVYENRLIPNPVRSKSLGQSNCSYFHNFIVILVLQFKLYLVAAHVICILKHYLLCKFYVSRETITTTMSKQHNFILFHISMVTHFRIFFYAPH